MLAGKQLEIGPLEEQCEKRKSWEEAEQRYVWLFFALCVSSRHIWKDLIAVWFVSCRHLFSISPKPYELPNVFLIQCFKSEQNSFGGSWASVKFCPKTRRIFVSMGDVEIDALQIGRWPRTPQRITYLLPAWQKTSVNKRILSLRMCSGKLCPVLPPVPAVSTPANCQSLGYFIWAVRGPA